MSKERIETRSNRLLIEFLPLLLLVLGVALNVAAQTFTVTGGAFDNTIGGIRLADNDDGVCDATNCSLREAINAANVAGGTINFSSAGIVLPATPLPAVGANVTIDGYANAIGTPNSNAFGSPWNAAVNVEIRGGGSGDGLLITGANSIIQGLMIDGFVSGIHISATNVAVAGCLVTSNPGDGITVDGGTSSFIGSLSGGATDATRNVISGNGSVSGSGISIVSPAAGATIINNYIGPDAALTMGLGNGTAGISVASNGNTIGAVGKPNLVSGNSGHGILVSGGSNIIKSNFIGPDGTGAATFASASQNFGIEITGASATGNTVGGTAAGEANVISANSGGVALRGGAASNSIVGNNIGIDVSGTIALPNFVGVQMSDAGTSSNVVDQNVISGNSGTGVEIAMQFGGAGADGNSVTGNKIGTDVAGTAAVANTGDGIYIDVSANTTISNNTISGNGSYGIEVDNQIPLGKQGVAVAPSSATTATIISGNKIGTDVTGTSALGNGAGGIAVRNGSDASAITGNVVSGNTGSGILVADSPNTKIESNKIGTDLTGTVTISNSSDGVAVSGPTSAGSNVGSVGTGNTISGNGLNGIALSSTSAVRVEGNTIQGNSLNGVDVDSSIACSILTNAIFGNFGIGIDLHDLTTNTGATANDATDADTGSNNYQNFPQSITALYDGTKTSVVYSVDSSGVAGTAALKVELFKADSFAQGQQPLWTSGCIAGNTLTNAAVLIGAPLVPGDTIVMTATSYSDAGCTTVGDGTSEFSSPATVAPKPLVVYTSAASGPGSLYQAFVDSNSGACVSPTPCAITFNLPLSEIQGSAPNRYWHIPVSGTMMTYASYLTVDGDSQVASFGSDSNASGPEIFIDGLGSAADAFEFFSPSSNVTVKNLAFGNFTTTGIVLGANNSILQGCNIGLDALGAPAPIGGTGISLIASNSNVSTNKIAACATQGISVSGSGNLVETNTIGLSGAGNGNGISLTGGTNTFGANVIAFNTGFGLKATQGVGNEFVANVIHDNVNVPVDLDDVSGTHTGATPNDAGDSDVGANNIQNFPAITSAQLVGGNLTVKFDVDSSANTSVQSLRVELFKAGTNGSAVALPAGCFAGRQLTGQTMTISGAGLTAADSIVATATSFTDASCTTVFDGTSEFSPAAAINAPPVANNDSVTTAEDTPGTFTLMSNDTDPDGDTLIIISNTPASNGSVTCSSADCTYTPSLNYNGPDSFTYTISDPGGLTSTATVNVTVTPVNDPPVAVPDSYATNEDTPLTVAAPGVLANDTDIDSPSLTATLATAPANGTVSVNANGSFTYTPNANFNGSDSFTYNASDGSLSSTATVTISIAPVNDPPVANPDAYTTAEDTPLTVAAPGVMSNDTDIDSLPQFFSTGPGTPAANGTVAMGADGSFTYTPNANYNGTDSFTYILNDGSGGSASGTVTINITPVNDPPVGVNDSATTAAGTPVTTNVTANDTDVDGNPLSVASSTNGANGSVVCSGTNCTYTPNAGFFGSDSYTYNVTDGLATSPATVSVTVTPVADLSIAKSAAPEPVVTGGTLTYTITVTNLGPTTASSITVSDVVPAGVTLPSATGTGWSCIQSGGTVTCTRPSLAVGAAPAITLTVIAPSTAGSITNTASVSSATADPSATNNTASATTTVRSTSVVVTSTADSGPGTLRQAILDANAGICLSPCTITFNLAPPVPAAGYFKISPLAPLPDITASNVTIDGTSQTGATGNTNAAGPEVILDGTLLGAGGNGLRIISASGDAIHGLGFIGFGGAAITVDGSGASGNTISGNFIGTDGATALGAGNGIVIGPLATNTTVGGTGPIPKMGILVVTSGNVISGNSGTGLAISGNGNTAIGNFIGTDATGTTPIPNGVGVAMSGTASTNTIGTSGQGNVIAFNTAEGVRVDGGTGNSIRANAIHANGTLGIDLAPTGVNANDPGDADTGPNDLQNTPVLAAASFGGVSTTISGTLDTIPGSYTLDFYENATADPTGSGEGETWLGSLPVSTSTGPTPFTFTVSGDHTAKFLSATATSSGGSTSEFAVVLAADLMVTVTPPATIVPGQPAVYTITVKNNGPSAASSVLVTDTTPTGFTFVSNNGACTTAYPCTIASLASGASQTITTTFSVPASYTTPNPASNTATVNSPLPDPNTANNTATVTTAVAASADVAITKSASLPSVIAGTALNYTLNVSNAGPSDAANVSVSDTLPAGYTVTSIAQTGWTCSLAGQTVTCTRTVLGAGVGSTITINGTAPQTAGTITNTATVTAATADPNAANNNSTVSTSVVTQADLSIKKTASANPVAALSSFTYTLTVDNFGPNASGGITVTDTLPAGVTYLGASGPGFTCAQSLGIVTCTHPGLPSGFLTFLTVTVKAPTSGGSITNTATVSSSTTDPVSTNNSASATITVNDVADLTITKAVSAPTATLGDTVVFTISVKNNGPSTAQNVVVSDPTPGALLFVSNSGACTTAFPCSLGTLGAGVTKTITATYEVAGKSPTAIVNTATVTSTTADPNTVDNTASASITTCPVAVSVLRPVPNSTGAPTTGLLNWDRVDAASYTAYLGEVGSGCQTVLGSTTSNSIQYNNLKPGTTYEWRVVAIKPACGAGVSSACVKFTTAPKPCNNPLPSIIEPASGASAVASPVTFKWNAAAGAIGYNVYVGVNGATPSVIGSTTTDTTLTANVDPGPVVWYVEALFDGCPSTRSPDTTFTAGPVPCDTHVAPQLLLPDDGVTMISPVSFSWTAVPAATGYRVWVSIGDEFPIIVASTTTETTAIAPVPAGALHWYVEALFDGCPPTLSQRRGLTVAVGSNCPTTPPVLGAPAGGSTIASPVTFSWSQVPAAFGYTLWVGVDDDAPSIVATTSGSAATTLTRDIQGGHVQWFVEALVPNCNPLRSQPSDFTVPRSQSCANGVAALVAPAAGATDQPGLVEFSWIAVDNATEYRVWAKIDNAPAQVVASTLVTTKALAPAFGTSVEWWIETLFNGCPPTESEHRTFTLATATSCSGDKATLLSPNQGQALTERAVTMSWSSVSSAVGYRVRAAVNQGAYSTVAIVPAPLTAVTVDMPYSTIKWYVETITSGCPLVRSDEGAFTLAPAEGCDIRPPYLVAPPNGLPGLTSPVQFGWTPVPAASGYRVWLSLGDGAFKQLDDVVHGTDVTSSVPQGLVRWYVEAIVDGCDDVRSAPYEFTVVPAPPCGTPKQPVPSVVAQITPGQTYRLSWTPVPGSTIYEVQERTGNSFAGAPVTVVQGTFLALSKTVQGTYSYRVRAIGDCNQERGAYSEVVSVRVTDNASQGEVGDTAILSNSLNLGFDSHGGIGPIDDSDKRGKSGVHPNDGTTATVSTTTPWMSVTPSTITIPPGGTATVTVTSTTSGLPVGASTGFVTVTPTSSSVPPSNIPNTVSLVTPVSATPRNEPAPESLIIPAVAHASGTNSTWLSDIRLANFASQLVNYQINFTPAGMNGTQVGQQTTLSLDGGKTTALNDIVANWFGGGSAGQAASGVLEIRPLNAATSALSTIASSRTYNLSAAGTFGQFIPAVLFSQFVGKPADAQHPTTLSLQQISQSSNYRTNFGLVEASGHPATVQFTVFGDDGSQIGSFPISLQAGEYRQYNALLADHGITLEDGRVEINVTSDEGKVTAYASVVDNGTNDPLVVPAVQLANVSTDKYIVPGVAEINTGSAHWRTDMRLFNASPSVIHATARFYPQGNPADVHSADVTIQPGEVKVVNSAVATLFGMDNVIGVIQVTTPSAARFIVTARTYDQQPAGTYGQFIPAMTVADSIGAGERALQILQLEQSDGFRTNVGIAEVTGKAANIEVMATVPDKAVAAVLPLNLRPNEFVQLSRVLSQLGITNATNARISVGVVGGQGRVIAYGSVVDNQTQDPTYVPAQ